MGTECFIPSSLTTALPQCSRTQAEAGGKSKDYGMNRMIHRVRGCYDMNHMIVIGTWSYHMIVGSLVDSYDMIE